jgi:hypothetical protein
VTSGTAWFSTTSTVRPLGEVCDSIFGGSVVGADAIASTMLGARPIIIMAPGA